MRIWGFLVLWDQEASVAKKPRIFGIWSQSLQESKNPAGLDSWILETFDAFGAGSQRSQEETRIQLAWILGTLGLADQSLEGPKNQRIQLVWIRGTFGTCGPGSQMPQESKKPVGMDSCHLFGTWTRFSKVLRIQESRPAGFLASEILGTLETVVRRSQRSQKAKILFFTDGRPPYP